MSAFLRLLGYRRCVVCGCWSRHLIAHTWVDHGDAR